MKYFLHDSNSFNDEKVTELFINFGYEGLGLFYTILERIAQQEKPMKTDVLKSQLKVGKRLNKCWEFMESLDLISSNNGDTFNKQLLNFSEKYQIKKEKNRKRIAKWREEQDIVTCNKHVRNTPKVKESKVNRSKGQRSLKMTETDFSIFWEIYPRKVKKKLAQQKFYKLNKELLPNILKALKKEIKSEQWKKKEYIPHPTSWLNGERWEDEILEGKIIKLDISERRIL